MSKQGLTEIVCIIDSSGSMWRIKDDAIGGFNEFLKTQKELPGEATMTVALFDTRYELLVNDKNIRDVQPLNDTTYVPGGMTALLDAVGKTIDAVGVRLASTPEEQRPEKVIVVILTDGQENASVEYNRAQVLEKIRRQTDTYKWQFLYLGANQDAFAEAGKIGIDATFASNFVADKDGMRNSVMAMGCATTNYRATGDVGSAWKLRQ